MTMNQTEPNTENLQINPQNRRSHGRKNIPIEKLIELRKKNLSYSQIAAILNIHPKSVQYRLQPIAEDIELTKDYVKNRTEILQYKQRELLNAITPTKIAKAHLQQLVWSFGVLYDKERLESGKSTANISYANLLQSQERVATERESIDAEILRLGGSVDNPTPEDVDKPDNDVTP